MIVQSATPINDMINHVYRTTVYTIIKDPATNKQLVEVVQYLYNKDGDLEPTHHNYEIDKKALASVISSIPYSQRILNNRGNDSFVLLTSNNANMPFFTMRTDPADPANHIRPNSTWKSSGEIGNGYGDFNNDEAISYFAYLRQMNKSFNDNDLKIILNSTYYDRNKKAFATNNPPVNADNVYRIAQMNNDVVLINTQNPRESFMLSSARNNLKKLNLPPQYANQLLGIAAPAAAAGAPAAGRRG